MTCIIGMYYDSGTGALVIADSRTMIGGDYSRDRKVFDIDNQVVFAAAGYTGIAEKLVPNVKTTRYRLRQFLPPEIVRIFEDEMAELYNRYKMTKPYRFGYDQNLLTGIIGYLDGDEPKLECLHENGYAEVIRDFRAIGHGARHAHNILRALHAHDLPRDRAIEIGVHAMVEVSKVDAMVDAYPQIAILQKGQGKDGLKILNLDSNGKFHFERQNIEKTKSTLAGMEETRTRVFHLLLDGSKESRKKLDETLKDYDDESKGGKSTNESSG